MCFCILQVLYILPCFCILQVLQAFAPCIIRPQDDYESSPSSDKKGSPDRHGTHEASVALCERVVTFLMDNYAEVMKVPEDLHKSVLRKLDLKSGDENLFYGKVRIVEEF